MMTWTLRTLAAIFAATAVWVTHAQGAPAKAPRKGVFTIVNKTAWTIREIHITEAEEDAWSANLIKGKPLAKGGTVKLDVECYEQDVKLVDGKGRTCTSESMCPCDRDSTWTLTPEGLAGCKDFGR
jgi:hypothetical protein